MKHYPTVEIKNNYYQNYINGNEISSQAYFIAKGFIVKGMEQLLLSRTWQSGDSAMGICFYDETYENQLGGTYFSTEYKILDVPSNAFYTNITFHKQTFKNLSRFLFTGFNKYQSYFYSTEIKKLNGYFDIEHNLEDGYINLSGRAVKLGNYKHTPFIEIGDYVTLNYGLVLFQNTAISIYSSADETTHITSFAGTTSENTFTEGTIDLNKLTGAKYFRATIFKYNENFYVRGIKGQKLITTDLLSDGCVTKNKLSIDLFTHNKKSNYIDKTKLKNKYYIDASGYEHYTNNVNYYITDKIYLDENTNYYWYHLYGGYYCFYADDDTVINA